LPTKRIVTRAVPAASRTIAILQFLARSDQPQSLTEIASALGLVPSTCLHILRVLVEAEMVALDERGRQYRLGVGVLPLARSMLRRNSIAGLIQPEIDRLSKRFGASVIASEITGPRHIVVVAVSHAAQPIRLNVEVGSRYPTLISVTGRCYAAFGGGDPVEFSRQLGTWRWAKPPDPQRWLREVAATRRQGYAVDSGNYIAGATLVAAPIYDQQGALRHTVGVVGFTEAIRACGIDTLGAALIEVARRVGGEPAERRPA